MQEDLQVPTHETQPADQAIGQAVEPVAAGKPRLKYLLGLLALLAVVLGAVFVFGFGQTEEEQQTEEMKQMIELEAERAADFQEEEFIPYEELPIM